MGSWIVEIFKFRGDLFEGFLLRDLVDSLWMIKVDSLEVIVCNLFVYGEGYGILLGISFSFF